MIDLVGTAQAFFPSIHHDSRKPYIMVAGDGSQQAFYLVPDEDEPFKYKQELLFDCKSVVGGIDVIDVNGDGFVEVFVPCYYSGKVHVFSFVP